MKAVPLTTGPSRTLLIEDDVQLASLVSEYLREHEFQVNVEHRGDSGAERILRTPRTSSCWTYCCLA